MLITVSMSALQEVLYQDRRNSISLVMVVVFHVNDTGCYICTKVRSLSSCLSKGNMCSVNFILFYQSIA